MQRFNTTPPMQRVPLHPQQGVETGVRAQLAGGWAGPRRGGPPSGVQTRHRPHRGTETLPRRVGQPAWVAALGQGPGVQGPGQAPEPCLIQGQGQGGVLAAGHPDLRRHHLQRRPRQQRRQQRRRQQPLAAGTSLGQTFVGDGPLGCPGSCSPPAPTTTHTQELKGRFSR
jgi:hypothetical protein